MDDRKGDWTPVLGGPMTKKFLVEPFDDRIIAVEVEAVTEAEAVEIAKEMFRSVGCSVDNMRITESEWI